MQNEKFDPKKRHTLKLLSGTAMVASMPALAMNAGQSSAASDGREVRLSGEGAELSFSLHVDEKAVLKMSNNTDRLIIVRHVHPGIVHAGEQTFDINSAFQRSAYEISAGHTRSVVLEPVNHLAGEVDFPRARYRKMPQRIVSVTGSDERGLLVNSTRSFYA